MRGRSHDASNVKRTLFAGGVLALAFIGLADKALATTEYVQNWTVETNLQDYPGAPFQAMAIIQAKTGEFLIFDCPFYGWDVYLKLSGTKNLTDRGISKIFYGFDSDEFESRSTVETEDAGYDRIGFIDAGLLSKIFVTAPANFRIRFR